MRAKDTIEVREGEELNVESLKAFLISHFSLPHGEIEIEQFPAGHSNLTYLIKVGTWEAVLRRPPFGPVAPKAHDMARESAVLKKLHPHFKLAPKPYLYCEDDSVIGKPFFLMERRKGIILDKSFPKGYSYSTEDGIRLSQLMVDQLVALHSLEIESTGIIEIGHPNGFLERQVKGWISRYERAKTEEIKDINYLHKWLTTHIPTSPLPTVIHYDYKFNNVMFDEQLKEIVGIFDWEMATIGDPLADVACTLSYWVENSDPDFLKHGLGESPITTMPGFYTREDFIQDYALKSGRDVSEIHYYLTFAYYKLAVICQQIYYRWKKGQTKDSRFAHMDEFVKGLIHLAVFNTKKGL